MILHSELISLRFAIRFQWFVIRTKPFIFIHRKDHMKVRITMHYFANDKQYR